MQRNLLGLALGVVVGLFLTMLIIIPGITYLAGPEIQDGGQFLPCEDRRDPLLAKHKSLQEEKEALRPKWEKARVIATQMEGKPIPWPDDLSSSFRKPSMEILVKAAIEKAKGVSVRGWHCDEYPCIIALEAPRPRSFEPFVTALTARGFDGLQLFSRRARRGPPKRTAILVLTYWEGEGGDALRKRVGWRMNTIIGDFFAVEGAPK